MLPQGLNDMNFYKLLEGSILNHGYGNLADFFREVPNYFEDEREWKAVYDLAPFANPTRTFTQKIGNTNVPIMATYLSDDAETPVRTNEGFEMQTGDIPRMGQGYFFSTKSYDDARNFSRDYAEAYARVWAALLVDTNMLIKGVHAQRSFTGFQIESKGSYISSKLNNNGGISNLLISANPVASNRKSCGGFHTSYSHKGKKVAWSDVNANPIGDLQDMFEYAVVNRILPRQASASVFRMGKAAFDMLKNHESTKTSIAMWKTGYLMPKDNLPYYEVTDGDFNNYIASLNLPKIEVVDYYGFIHYLDKETKEVKTKDIAAFDENTVVLRYAGKFGEFQWARVSNLFETADSPVYYTEGGAMAIQQDTKTKGVKFSAESLCAPVPYAIEKVLYLSINQAAL